ncbi:MAG: PorT family protein [Saprospiraceae bacterium]|nr:PorT family protein [Saprospiraceae bacterium]
MKAQLILLIFLLSSSFMASAQWQLGISGGPVMGNFNVFRSSDDSPIASTAVSTTPGTGFQFNMPVQYSISKYIAVQAEIGYQRQVAGINRTYYTKDQLLRKYTTEDRYQMNQFQSSLLLKISTGGSKFQLYGMAGPSMSYFLGGNKERTEISEYQGAEMDNHWYASPIDARNENMQKGVFSFTGGIGMNIILPAYTVFVEGRQSFGTKNAMSTPTETIKFRNRAFQVGVLFNLK